ncbi:terminase [Salinisphaera orenii MK-B5]|uniref:Terminase n=1 Tax=Salinisphaera orenii MK-B5 TaxID=856730 RepID=A0A423PXV0_9GAMM|nr:terminase TerL endonuclease subunit [Salinisphaera orenii]ROO30414.1 terminase [Salinisphaera orenii MK-B5]
MSDSKKAIDFIQSLEIPEGPKAGKPIKLAKFQKQFIRGALKKSTAVAVLSVGRGNGKSALTAGLALGELLGAWDTQPRREVLTAARTREQAKIVWQFMFGLAATLPDEIQDQLHWRRAPYTEVEFDGDGGGHICKCIAADPKNALGTAPTLAIMDERGHWPSDKGDDLEAALLSGLGKRGGRAVIISTSASDDTHSLSQWLDDPPPGTYVQEHRPAPGLPADDFDSIIEANPGAKAGIGSSPQWLQAQAQRAIARGGSALASFRLYNRNERTSAENRDVLLTVDDWLAAETSELPPREGGAIVGVDLGGSASMSAAALYWPNTGRLEAVGAFPSNPSLADRGQRDGVRDRYVEMKDRDELLVMGEKIVPAPQFLQAITDRLDTAPVTCFVADRYRQSEFEEALQAAGLRVPVVWRGMGFKDGGEDCERFRSAVFDGLVQVRASLLLRSAFADAVTLRDPANNMKLAKARSTGRIDAAAATILAVAEGRRRSARPAYRARSALWA